MPYLPKIKSRFFLARFIRFHARFLPVSVFKIFPLKRIRKNIEDLTFYTAMIMQDQSYLAKQWLNLKGSCKILKRIFTWDYLFLTNNQDATSHTCTSIQ